MNYLTKAILSIVVMIGSGFCLGLISYALLQPDPIEAQTVEPEYPIKMPNTELEMICVDGIVYYVGDSFDTPFLAPAFDRKTGDLKYCKEEE